MTAKPETYYSPTATLTAASCKALNLRRKMRETQPVLANFSITKNCLPNAKSTVKNKFTNPTFIKTETKIKHSQLKVFYNNNSLEFKIASEKWNALCLIKGEPFDGSNPTRGFYCAAEKSMAIGVKLKNEFLDKNS